MSKPIPMPKWTEVDGIFVCCLENKCYICNTKERNMPEKEDTIQKYIDYWDEVIRQWLQYNADYKSFTGDAAEQRQIIEAINSTVGKNPDYWLNIQHMPEPYWGNPQKCSIVLLDYNPAGGPEISRHTSINCKDCAKCGISFINFINSEYLYNNNKGYSSFALNGPTFQSKEEIKHNNLRWFSDKDNGYGGYHWWQEKKEWAHHLVNAICGNVKRDNKYPWGMELCGWHSKKWSNNMNWIDEGECHEIVNRRVIQPLFAAMKNSLWNCSPQIAACIGAEFKEELLNHYFGKINNITKNISEDIKKEVIDTTKSGFDNLSYTLQCDKSNILHVTAKWGKKEKKNRNYRVFHISENDESYYILNTFYRGSNHHPAEHFWPFEKELINVIKEHY